MESKGKFERVPGGRKESESPRGEAIRNFRVIQGGLGRHEQKILKETVEDARIEEEKVFSKDEVLDIIWRVAEAEGFKKEEIEVESEYYDKKGNLVVLHAKVKQGKAKGMGWDNILYDYIIKGHHGKAGGNMDTTIARVFVRNEGRDFQGGIVAKYEGGKWQLSPGKISPQATDVRPIE